ncbi:MAG TPA: hypothetical protein VFZ24_05275 [Longimicrobiales bacterium]
MLEPAGIAIEPGHCLGGLPDSDADGLADECELALARAFAPLLMTHATRCTLPSIAPAVRIPGGYVYAAQPLRDGVHLIYMPAYYRDCGWRGAKCILVDCRGHAGDSELIVVHVRQGRNAGWYTDAVFLSAHCFGRMPWSCRWYRDDDLSEFAWNGGVDRGAPVVWVSDARNANYPSYQACERGHLGFDSCVRSAGQYRFPVISRRNIGSRNVPIRQPGEPAGCVTGEFVEPVDWLLVSATALECFWNPTVRFRGWQGSGEGATAYGAYLEHLGL